MEPNNSPYPPCVYLEKCPIFKKFRSEGLANVWISTYCQGHKMEQCERRILTKKGIPHPITLLPNGKHLAALAFDSDEEEI